MKRSAWRIAPVLALVWVAGCGGGGGGGGATGPEVTATVAWPARSRAVDAPSSARSVRVTLLDGATEVRSWSVNRRTDPAAYSEAFGSGQGVPAGTYTARIRFFADPGATGALVAEADVSVTVGEVDVDLGTVTVNKKVQQVSVAAGQVVAVGQDLAPVFTAKDAGGAILALSRGSAFFTLTAGADRAQVNGDLLRGVAAGLPSLKATVDGVTSAAQPVGVGTAAFVLGADGTRGRIPVFSGGNTERLVGDGETVALTSAWFAANPLVAPARYADRAFSAWKLDGTTVSTSATLARLPALLPGQTLNAVYVPSDPGAGGFTPNYARTDHGYWPSMPRTYWIDPAVTGTARAAVIAGIDRWEDASGGAIDLNETTTEGSAHIKIRFGSPAGGVAGLTTTGGVLEAGNVLRMSTASILFNSNLLPANTDTGKRLLEAITCHEMGHALGIIGSPDSGHSTDSKDTMFPTVTELTRWPTARDMNTIATLYPGRFNGRHRPVTRAASGPEVQITIACPMR